MGARTFTFEKECVIKSLVDMGVKYREIQKIIPVALGHISEIVKKFEAEREFTEYYKANRADILANIQARSLSLQKWILESVAEKDLKKANLKLPQKMQVYETLGKDIHRKHEEERLERDQSTENIGVIWKHIQDMKKKDKEDEEPIDVTPEQDRAANQG